MAPELPSTVILDAIAARIGGARAAELMTAVTDALEAAGWGMVRRETHEGRASERRAAEVAEACAKARAAGFSDGYDKGREDAGARSAA